MTTSKKKRCPSGYNLYIKSCTRDKPFGECITSGEWKGKLSDKERAEWNKKAADQCVK